MGRGDMGSRVIAADGLHDLQSGVAQISILTQVIPHGTGGTVFKKYSGIIHAAVQTQRTDGDFRHGHVERSGISGIRGDGRVLAGQLCTGRVADDDDALWIQMIAGSIFAYPLHHGIGIPQRCGEAPLGCKAVVEVDEGKATAGHIHAVAAVNFLAAVYIAAAMDGYNGRQGSSCAIGIINVQQIPLAVASIGNIAALGDSFR